MRELSKQTQITTPKEALASRKWFIVDATDQPLGRLASRIATVLKGKHKPTYQPHVDTGDSVVVINAEKVKISGKKLQQKIAFRHSMYPGGAMYIPYDRLILSNPGKIVELAVKGMLPKSSLGRKQRENLYVYKGTEHPHKAQKPAAFPAVLVKP